MSEPDRPPAETCNCLALRQASRHVTQLYDQAMARLGLRVTQFSILAKLHQAGPTTIHELARLMVMDRSTLGHNLRPLQKQDLVALAVATDRRRRAIALTAAGSERLAQGWRAWRDTQRRFEASLGAERARALRELMADVAALTFAEP